MRGNTVCVFLNHISLYEEKVKYRHCHGTTAAASRRESRRAVAAAAACKEIFLFYVEISFK